LEDAVKHTAIRAAAVTVSLSPAAPLLDPDRLVYRVLPNRTYAIVVAPRRGLNYETRSSVTAAAGATEVTIPVLRRRTVLYITVDRPTELDTKPLGHRENMQGALIAAQQFDPDLELQRLDLAAVPADRNALEQEWHPFAIFGAGSFSEWFHYANGADPNPDVGPEDATWTRRLDSYMALIRNLDLPMFAVCGSHQLVAAAFNQFGALAHMNNAGPPIPITAEHANVPHRNLAPTPHVGEEGTYPLAVTAAGSTDPVLSRALAGPAWGSSHHKDMVTNTERFVLLLEPDYTRAPATRIQPQANPRCQVQGMRLDDPERLLYATQFHPEIRVFTDATDVPDGEFGLRLLVEFFREVEIWWRTRSADASVRDQEPR
jgi:hypothetical protein